MASKKCEKGPIVNENLEDIGGVLQYRTIAGVDMDDLIDKQDFSVTPSIYLPGGEKRVDETTDNEFFTDYISEMTFNFT